MNAYRNARLMGVLVVAGLASAAAAMELNQSPAPASAEAPAFVLPAFLDDARLPDLQEAWREHFSAVTTAADPAPPASTPEGSALETASDALTRAEKVSIEAVSVRERAEELSRRFGAEAAETKTAAPGAPTETASIDKDGGAADATPPVIEHELAPASDEATVIGEAPATPMRKAAAMTDDAPVIEDMATKPVARAKSSAPARQAAAGRKPLAVRTVVDTGPPKPQETTLIPTELRALGWSAQP